MASKKKIDPHLFMTKASKCEALMAADMADEIKEVIYGYAGKVSLALAVGGLRVVEREIMDDQLQEMGK